MLVPKTEDLRLSPRELMKRFLDRKRKRSEWTYVNYMNNFRRMRLDPFLLAEEAISKPRKIEEYVLDWMNRYIETHPRGARTVRQAVSDLKKSLSYCGASQIRWALLHEEASSINLPRQEDREVTKEEIRLIHDGGDKRLRFLNTLLYSSGIREGAFYYQVRPSMHWEYMRIKDLVPYTLDGVTIGKLTVYRGDPEEYVTFTSPENIKCFEEYKKDRILKGDNLVPESPMVASEKYNRFSRMRDHSILQVYDRAWRQVGLPAGVRKFHEVHGFRKAFKSQLEDTPMKSIHIEALSGRPKGMDRNYYLPAEVEKRAREYIKYMDCLYISDVPRLEKQLNQEKNDNASRLVNIEAQLIVERDARLQEKRKREVLEIKQEALERYLAKPTNKPLKFFIEQVKRERSAP
jgi:hypothetical protein